MEGGSRLGNEHLSLGFLSESQGKWVPSWWTVIKVSLKKFSFCFGAKDSSNVGSRPGCPVPAL